MSDVFYTRCERAQTNQPKPISRACSATDNEEPIRLARHYPGKANKPATKETPGQTRQDETRQDKNKTRQENTNTPNTQHM